MEEHIQKNGRRKFVSACIINDNENFEVSLVVRESTKYVIITAANSHLQVHKYTQSD